MNNEKGYALLVSILSIVLISIIGISLFSITNVTHSQTVNERKDQSIFYIAEAGLNIKEARLEKLIEQAYSEAKADEDHFESIFNSKLESILNTEAASVYDHTVFQSKFNGEPRAVVTIEREPLNQRAFKIVSKGVISGISNERTVEKSYTIPGTLVQKTTVQVPIVNTPTPIVPIQNQPPSITIPARANIYLSKGIFLDAVSKDKIKFNAYASFEKNDWNLFKYINTRVTPVSVLNDVWYKQPNASYTLPKIQHPNTPSFSESTSGTISLTSTSQKINKNLRMPNFNFKNNLVFNFEVEPGNHTIFFDENLNDYNLTTVRMNVTGSGTLNLVFKNNFQLNSGYKFYINAPNTKVNTIFKEYAHIKGEFTVQDIYLLDNWAKESAIIAYAGGKINAKNIYAGHADVSKYVNGQINVDNTISVKNGNLEIMGKGPLYANQIQLENGRINFTGSVGNIVNLSAKNIILEKKDLNLNAYSCTMAQNLYVPNGTLNIHGNANFSHSYSQIWHSTAGVEINTNKCTNDPIVITPPQNEVGQEFTTVTEYTYLHEASYLQTTPLVEVD